MKSLLQKFLSASTRPPHLGGPRKRRFPLGEGRWPQRGISLTGGGRARGGGAQSTLRPHPRPHLPLARPSLRAHPRSSTRKAPTAQRALRDRERTVKSAPRRAGRKMPRRWAPLRPGCSSPCFLSCSHTAAPTPPSLPEGLNCRGGSGQVQERGPKPSPASLQGALGGGTVATNAVTLGCPNLTHWGDDLRPPPPARAFDRCPASSLS